MSKNFRKFSENLLTYHTMCDIILSQRKGNRSEYGGRCQKGETMDEDMTVAEMLRNVSEENQTRKILDIIEKSKDLAEAIEKVRALLTK